MRNQYLFLYHKFLQILLVVKIVSHTASALLKLAQYSNNVTILQSTSSILGPSELLPHDEEPAQAPLLGILPDSEPP